MGKRFGNGRASTTDRDLSIQAEALERAGCIASFLEKKSGTTTEGREDLRRVLCILGEGDELVVVRLDRLARSVADLADIVRQMEMKGASLRCMKQPADTGSAAGRAFVGMPGVFVEFETGLRRERRMDGLAGAKREDCYEGRQWLAVSDDVARLASAGMGPTAIAKRLGIGGATVHRRLAEQRLRGVGGNCEGSISSIDAAPAHCGWERSQRYCRPRASDARCDDEGHPSADSSRHTRTRPTFDHLLRVHPVAMPTPDQWHSLGAHDLVGTRSTNPAIPGMS